MKADTISSNIHPISFLDQNNKKTLGIINLVLAAAASVVITAALIALMHSLIYQDFQEPEQKPDTKIASIHLPERIIKIIKTPKPEPIEEALPPPEAPTIELTFDTKDHTTLTPVNIKTTINKKQTIDFSSSSSLVKRVVAPPVYPRRASARGIEGYVDLVFDVSATGATKNIRVTAAEPAGVFEKSAVAAINRYKYRPQKIDGVEIATPNVRERIRYQLTKL